MKIIAIALGALTVIVGAAYAYALWAMRDVQPFYEAAIRVKPHELESASQRMESRLSALYSDALPPGRWQTVFTDNEVNGWLAVAFEESYAELLPPGASDPRVIFSDGRGMIGFRYQGEQVDSVISVEAEARMADDDVVAVRLLAVRAGSLPLPMSTVEEQVSAAAAKKEIPIRWTVEDGDPVLLVPIANVLSTAEERRQLDRLELREGELVLAGSTEPQPDPEAAGEAGSAKAEAAISR